MSGSSEAPKTRATIYDALNDSLRFEEFAELDDVAMIGMRRFFREIGVPHLFEEYVIPTFKGPDSLIFAAVKDRPWPPWGHGSQTVAAFVQAHAIAENSYALGPVLLRSELAANIGLRAALYKEALEGLSRQGKAEVYYLVIEGSVLTDQILTAAGFKRTADLVQTDEAKYFFYHADCQELLKQLQLSDSSVPELLTLQVAPPVIERSALFLGVMDWAAFRELLPIWRGGLHESIPGGVPDPPPPPACEVEDLQ
jgi:hypothetical protein